MDFCSLYSVLQCVCPINYRDCQGPNLSLISVNYNSHVSMPASLLAILCHPCHSSLASYLPISQPVGALEPGVLTPTSEFMLRAPVPDGWCKKKHKVYPGSGKRRPYVQRGEETCIILHLSACGRVTSAREGELTPSVIGWLSLVPISSERGGNN